MYCKCSLHYYIQYNKYILIHILEVALQFLDVFKLPALNHLVISYNFWNICRQAGHIEFNRTAQKRKVLVSAPTSFSLFRYQRISSALLGHRIARRCELIFLFQVFKKLQDSTWHNTTFNKSRHCFWNMGGRRSCIDTPFRHRIPWHFVKVIISGSS